MRVKKKCVRKWLEDNIIVPTRTFEEQLAPLRKTFDYLRQSRLSVNLPKYEFCFSVVEWLRMIIDRFGIRPAPRQVETITQLSQPSTVEGERVLLEMASYLWKFALNYSSVLAPISDLLRDLRFRSKQARRLMVPWGQAQTEGIETLVIFSHSHQSSLSPTGTNLFGYTRTTAKQEQEHSSHRFKNG